MTKIQTYTPEADSHFVVWFLDGMLAGDKISCENDNYVCRNVGKLSFLRMT